MDFSGGFFFQMNYKKLVTNALVAFSAQGISLVVSFVMSLLVPKVLGVASYGYWQLFIFYAGYSGFFHFGLNDGVYLVEGGKSRNEINKVIINSQFRVAVWLQVLIGAIVCLLSVVTSPEEERVFVIYAFSFYTVISNLQLYLGYVFQAMNETKLFSFSTMLDRLIFLVPLLACVVLHVSDFRTYIVLYCFSRLCSLAYCCWQGRDFFKAGVLSCKKSVRLAASSIRIGFGLMLANVANILILGIARALVDYAWGIEAFGCVSFSLSMVNFFTSFVSQASMVLFPALRQGSEDERRSFYQAIRDAMEVFFPGIYMFYFPMVELLSAWLPQYAESMGYFALLLPVCVFNTKMDICCTTYFKVLRKEKLLLAVNVATVVGSAIFSLIGVYCLDSIEAVLIGAVTCIVLRSFFSERYLNNCLHALPTHNPLQEVALTFAFIVLTLRAPVLIAIFGYLLLYAGFLIFNWDVISNSFRRLRAVFG